MTRFLVLLWLFALAACSTGERVHVLGEDELPSALYRPADTAGSVERPATAVIYLVRVSRVGDLLIPDRLASVTRQDETHLDLPEFAMRELLGPLDAEERDALLRTTIPGTQLLGLSVEGGVADVNLSAQFESPGAELIHQLRLAQVVWTLTELPNVDAVRFRIHGVPRPVIDQDGVAHEVVGRARYARFAPERSEGLIEPGAESGP